MDYFQRMKHRMEGKEPFVPGKLGDKARVKEIARFLGVKTPSVIHALPIEELLAADLPEEFVLKPEFASTSIGVNILRKRGDSFERITDGRLLSRADLLKQAKEISVRFLKDESLGTFYAEQLLRDVDGNTPPQDVRFYAFQGVIGLILMEHHLPDPARASYFDGDFVPLEDVHERYGVAPGQDHLEQIVQGPRPENWKELLNVAKRISMALPTAFARIDMYATNDGAYLGELTFYPGTFVYHNRKIMKPVEAERMGQLWGAASERLDGSWDYGWH